MSKVTAPLLSFGASGQIAKTQVYSTWKGRAYVRRYVVPSNPNVEGQQLTRRMFSYLQSLVKFGTPGMLAALGAYASVLRITTSNALMRASLPRLRTNKDVLPALLYDNTDLLVSPGARGAPGIPEPVITPGVGTLSVVVDNVVLPTGWTVEPAMYATAIPVWTGDAAEDVPLSGTIVEAFDLVPVAGEYTVLLPGLTSAADYVVNVWAVFTRPDLQLAYSLAQVSVETPS